MLRGREIANIQITAFEHVGVEQRVGYFDGVGTVRDMVQSHLLQLLALLTMSIPVDMSARKLQKERLSVLSAIDCPCDPNNVVLGQYAGYKKLADVPRNSQTETFAALRLFIDREDWYQVPVYVRTGKRLHERHTYVVVEFKKFPFQKDHEEPNRLIIELQPKEKISLTLVNRQEDIAEYQEVTTSDSIACAKDGCLPEHAVLLFDVLRGKKVHFLSFEEILAAWEVVDKITEHIQKQRIPLRSYRPGTKGPAHQDRLTRKDGFLWYDVHGQ